jgi:excisionase family DNA binding protein
MNKTEAAEFLGVSVRAVERYSSTGKIAARYERGKTGKVLAFDESELQRFKDELETPQERAPNAPDSHRQRAQIQAPTQPTGTALARRDGAANGFNIEVVRAMQTLAQLTNDNARQAAPTVPTEAKLLLTLAEAQALTGLSRGVLRAAIDTGDLKSKLIGRGWKIKRADLEKFVGKL